MAVFFFIIIIHILLTTVLTRLSSVENKGPEKEYFFKISNCLSDLIYKYSMYEGRVLVLLENEITGSFGEYLLKSGINAIVSVDSIYFDNDKSTHIFLLQPDIAMFNTTLQVYNVLLQDIQKSSYFLILWPHQSFQQLKSYMIQLHETFWQHRILKMASLIPSKKGYLSVYTYFPYTETVCGSGKSVEKVDECTTEGCKSNFNIFSNKAKIANFYKCSVKCFGNIQFPESVLKKNEHGSWDVFGNVVYLLNTLKDYHNLSLDIVEPYNNTHDWFYYNFPSQTLIEDYKKNTFEFGFGQFTYLNSYHKKYFDYSFPSNPECISWTIPKCSGKPPEFWEAYVSEFPLLFWGFLGFAISLATCLVIIGQIIEGNSISPLKMIRYWMVMAFSFITAPYTLKTKLFSVNFFILQWSVWGLVVRCAYEASLGSIVTVPIPFDKIDSHKKIMDSNLKVAGGIMMHRILRKAAVNNTVLTALADRFEIVPPTDGKDVVLNIFYNRNLAVLQPRRYAKYNAIASTKLLNSPYNPVSIMKPCFIQTYSSPIVIRKGSIMSELLFTLVQRLYESGLIKYWRMKDEKKFVHQARPRKLNFNKIRGVFFLYLIGITLSFCVWLAEVIYFNKLHNSKEKLEGVIRVKEQILSC